MRVACMTAGDIGVQALDLVGEAGFLKEIESPVNGRGLGRTFPVEICQQVVGFGWLRAFQQQAQNFAADTCHPATAPHYERFGIIQERLHVLRAAGRVGVDVVMSLCVGHGRNVVCFETNVKG